MAFDPVAIRKVEERYTAAWCFRSSGKVASFFDENATSIVNAGEPTVSRPAIAEAMEAFFADFPDLELNMDELRTDGNRAIFLWSLEGTNSGTGRRVRIGGRQNWRLSDGCDVAGYGFEPRSDLCRNYAGSVFVCSSVINGPQCQ